MEYRNRKTGEVINYQQLLEECTNVYIPPFPTAEYLDAVGEGYDLVFEVVPSNPYADHQRDGVELVDGKWVQKWVSTPWAASRITAEQAALAAAERAHNQIAIDAYLADVREMRERALNRLAGIATAAVCTGDTATVTSFLAARQRLLDITKIPGALAAKTVAELEAAIKPEYASIVKTAAPILKSAFDKVDQ